MTRPSVTRRSPRPVRLALAVLCAAALAGCASMAPSYVQPAAPVPAQFRDAPPAAADAMPVAELDWRQVFLDERLRQVIAQALQSNRDLRVALLNIEKARAQYRIQSADLLPSVDATLSRTAARSSAAASSSGVAAVSRSASATVGFSSWELDLFGRIRSLQDEAAQTFLATAETQRSTRMSLLAEVASDWLNVGAYRQRVALAQQTLESQRRTLQLTEFLHGEGAASGVDLASIQGSVESARADVATYATALEQARHALELVVGAPVPDSLLPDTDDAETAVALAPLPANLSSRVLLQRPDVLSAEYVLKAANADIGAARAAFFPSISLTTTVGVGSSALSNLFDAGTRTWSFIPTVSVPIFRAGALQASLDAAELSADVAVAQYEKAIQTAFGEVADVLAERARLDERLDAQRALVVASRRGYTLADARYRNGVDSSLQALTAQRTLYSAQQDLITLRLSEASNRVTLYKVFGGGADADG
ncbi:efflux transporter outer membrane subunit [Phytopseudomonas dryadis]|uniref:Transporter n=1 Tax=Phytopseudomonas dryadis TaxID=2487520 RepID=A0A4V2KBS4_9GAMM|nr:MULTISPECIES: efflux transporter outer membrane subunit [Pseudomonas]TBU88475.1 transporter [Pseudomonas dryadis]TBV09318.1 transporter [Pseudomonas dryadis]TBV18706.1 transporter [Pseudomonas sp. FRB 230]